VKPLVIGSALVTMAPAIFVTCFLLARTTPWLMNVGVAGGAICVLAGPIVAISGLARGFGDDVFLSARTDGVTFDRNGKAQGLTWEEVEGVAFEAPASLVFRLREGEPLVISERWDGVATEDLANQLEDIRRKASFNLLPKV
jgi:hypothetical protein